MKSWKETPILPGFKKWNRRNCTFLGYKKVTADAKLDLISEDLLILDRYICTINHMFGKTICDKFPSQFLEALKFSEKNEVKNDEGDLHLKSP